MMLADTAQARRAMRPERPPVIVTDEQMRKGVAWYLGLLWFKAVESFHVGAFTMSCLEAGWERMGNPDHKQGLETLIASGREILDDIDSATWNEAVPYKTTDIEATIWHLENILRTYHTAPLTEDDERKLAAIFD